MRRFAAVLAVVSLVGCSTYQQSKRTAQVGGVLAAAGIVAVGIAVGSEPPDDELQFGPSGASMAAMLLGGIGFWLLIGGLVGMQSFPDETTSPPAGTTTTRAPDPATIERREHAWALTKRAAAFARAGDCPTALAIGRELFDFDRDFHNTVYARDVAIQRCAWPEPAPATPQM